MPDSRRAERRPPLHRRPALPLVLAVLLQPPVAPQLEAQTRERVRVQGLVDAEHWNTDSGSRLLTRNEGDPAGAGRLRLWGAADVVAGLQGFALGEVEAGNGSDEEQTEVELEQAFLRYDFPGAARLRLDVGKILVPFGNFGHRSLSSINPLVGRPAGYDVAYPVGAVLGGKLSRVDWRLAVLDSPQVNQDYVPDADAALRPAASLGVTPAIGVRLAAYHTAGPYLGRGVGAALPAGSGWRDFDQQIFGLELALSRGYFELNGDLAFSRYEVPTRERDSRGRAWYLEPKYTWTPRFFTALRLEYDDYPFILPISSSLWIADNAAFYDVEVAAGWRFSPDLLLKAAYRWDHWRVDDHDFFPDGNSFALQVSYEFDVNSLFEQPR